MNKDKQIYNSRIAKNYLNFLEIHYPSVETDGILEYAGMTRYEVEDQVHWFTQQQMDRFHYMIVEKTGNPDISREAGRHMTSSKGMGPVKEYTLGFMSPALVYQAYGKVYAKFAKNATVTTKKRRANKVEITVTPKPGVQEKQHQCENRIGVFESLTRIFTGKYARVEHPVCHHRGHGYCLYIISWDKMPSRLWKRGRNYALVFSALLFPVLFFSLPAQAWMTGIFIALFTIGLMTHYSLHLEKKELIHTIEYQKEAARENLDQLNTRYNNALLVHEIGQAAATIVEIEVLIRAVMSAMERRLDFERGVLMLANEEKTRLIYVSGYGYSKAQEKQLQQTRFRLDRPDSKGFFVRGFKDQKSYLLEDLLANPRTLSERSRELARKMNVKAMVCVPIIYEQDSLGILAVDNPTSGRNLTQSDLNILTGIAAQTAVSINNARSFIKLHESEGKYRSILESMEDAYFEVDLAGNFTFVNDAACRFLGSPKKDLIGVNNRQYMDEKTARMIYNTFNKVYQTGIATKVPDWKLIRGDRNRWFVQMLVSLMRNADGEPVGFRGVARDVTEHTLAERERKRLEARLLQAEKMEAIGTLAGGVAHDLNNVLSGLVSYPELLLMDLPETSPLRKPILTIQKSGQRASAIVQDLLTLARRGVAVADVVNINQLITDYLKSPEHETIRLNYPEVKIETQLASNLLNILGSPVHLTKSLMNIVVNAAEAMAGGGKILIQSENSYLDRPVKGYDQIEKGEYAVLSVSDTGIGISAQDINRIFEPFYTKKVMGRSGSGLGMAVVWGTVKDHKGYIDVKSSEGEGTTFTLYFPVTRKTLSGEDDAFLMEKIMGKGESILVVDDVEEQREIAMEILRKLGYSVDTVPSGEAAVDFMKTRRADLMVLDMIMEPGMDGLQTYKRILELHPGQKTIIASGYSESERVREAQRLGAGAYVKKPYTTREIGTAVFSALRNRAD